MKYFILFLALLTINLYSQNDKKFVGQKGVQVILKGKITDENSGKPIGITMDFRFQNGKKFKIQSNSIDGSYSQILNAGDEFEIIFANNYDIPRTIRKVKVIDTNSFTEQEMDFAIKKFEVGAKFTEFPIFDENSTAISESGKSELDKIRELMLFNRSVKFEFVVNAHNTYFNKVEKKEVVKKKGKKKSETEYEETTIEPNPADIKQLVDNRIGSLKKHIESWKKFSDRITFVTDYSAGSEDNGNNSNSLIIKVNELKKALE